MSQPTVLTEEMVIILPADTLLLLKADERYLQDVFGQEKFLILRRIGQDISLSLGDTDILQLITSLPIVRHR